MEVHKISKMESWPVAKLRPFERNPKKHPESQIDKIAASIITFGFNDPIAALPDGTIVTGHGTVLAAKKLGMTSVPVTVLNHLKTDKMKGYLIAHNKTAEAPWDEELLTDLLAEVDTAGIDMLACGFTEDEMASLLSGANFLGDEKPEPKKNEPVERVAKPEPAEPREKKEKAPGTGNIDDLFSGLIEKPTWNKKRTVRFLSIRKWNSATKDKTLELFKKYKYECAAELIDKILSDVVPAIRQFIFPTPDLIITPPPIGASAKKSPGKHLATEISRRVAAELGCGFAEVFEPRPRGGGSHPRAFDRRGDLKIKSVRPGAVYLVLDDVSSSGTTLEECANAIGQTNMVFALSWIYESNGQESPAGIVDGENSATSGATIEAGDE